MEGKGKGGGVVGGQREGLGRGKGALWQSAGVREGWGRVEEGMKIRHFC